MDSFPGDDSRPLIVKAIKLPWGRGGGVGVVFYILQCTYLLNTDLVGKKSFQFNQSFAVDSS